ncbi:hypothetical protein IS360_003593 [Salmonella enterica]|nr:hypothetical protein [Salmonella enterica]
MTDYRRDPPPDELKDRVYYEDGQLYWVESERIGAHRRTDKPIGYICKNTGYRKTAIQDLEGKRRSYAVHRIIYWLLTGEWVPVLDHINGNRSDNRIENLRAVSVRENCINRVCRGAIPYVGVQYHQGSYRITLRIDGKQFWISGYKTVEAAALARDILARIFQGDFAKLNILDKEFTIAA